MKSDILVCSDPDDRHDRPVYTLDSECPACGANTENSAPAPYSPDDPHGEYRRRMRLSAARD